MTNTAATELQKFDGTRFMVPDGSVYVMEKANSDNYHGFVNKHFVGESVGDSMPVSKDVNDVKVTIFEYDIIFLTCLLFSPAYSFNTKFYWALKIVLFLFII